MALFPIMARPPQFTTRQGDIDHSINNALHPNLFQDRDSKSSQGQGKFHDTPQLTSVKSYQHQQQQQQQDFIHCK